MWDWYFFTDTLCHKIGTNLICCTSLFLSPPLLPYPASFKIWKLERTRLLVVFIYLTREYGLLIKVVVFVCMGLLLMVSNCFRLCK